MVVYKDNFFDKLNFQFLQNLVNNSIDLATLNAQGQWKKSSEYYSTDLAVIKNQLGNVYYHIFQKVKIFGQELTGYNLGLCSFRLQATLEDYIIDAHRDNDITGQGLDKSFSSIIYLHNSWNKDLGGEFYTPDIDVEPLPNRLLWYSRDELHGVRTGSNWVEPRRMMLLSWYKND
jgi:hypothetical protein